MNDEKLIFIVVPLIAISSLCIYKIQTAIISSKPDTSKWTLENDEFSIVPVVDDTVTFHVENKQGEFMFKCSNEWRAWDFKSLNIDNNNTITVVTGDMGTEAYRYDGITWR